MNKKQCSQRNVSKFHPLSCRKQRPSSGGLRNICPYFLLWQTLNLKTLWIIGTSTFFFKEKQWLLIFFSSCAINKLFFLYFSKSPSELLTKPRFMLKVNWFPLQLEKPNDFSKMEHTGLQVEIQALPLANWMNYKQFFLPVKWESEHLCSLPHISVSY